MIHVEIAIACKCFVTVVETLNTYNVIHYPNWHIINRDAKSVPIIFLVKSQVSLNFAVFSERRVEFNVENVISIRCIIIVYSNGEMCIWSKYPLFVFVTITKSSNLVK